jgi:hypothetical protein
VSLNGVWYFKKLGKFTHYAEPARRGHTHQECPECWSRTEVDNYGPLAGHDLRKLIIRHAGMENLPT